MRDAADTFDVVIVGAGPGGVAAAVTAAAAGRRVCLVDDGPFAGGQIWRNRGEMPKDRLARKWLARLDAAGEPVVRLRQSRVVANPAESTLLIETPAGPRLLKWQSLIVATGARELFLPFPGWTLPGVVGAGGLQALVKQGLPVRGKRIVVAGTGPLLLAVADLARAEGAIVPLVLEQTFARRLNRFALSLLRTPSKLLAAAEIRARLWGTVYATDAYPTHVAPAGGGVRVDYRWRGEAASIECDFLACGFNLVPNSELPQLLGCALNAAGFVEVDRRLRTSIAGVYAIGELTGIGGVEKAVIEGRRAVHDITGANAAADALAGRHAAALAFTDRLAAAFALRPEVLALAKPDTIICRCEDVRLSSLMNYSSGRDAKLQTRCGMGVCQGRVCGPAMQRMLGVEAPQVRPPVFVTAIGTLAGIAAGFGGSEK